jgi:hypothetical protein
MTYNYYSVTSAETCTSKSYPSITAPNYVPNFRKNTAIMERASETEIQHFCGEVSKAIETTAMQLVRTQASRRCPFISIHIFFLSISILFIYINHFSGLNVWNNGWLVCFLYGVIPLIETLFLVDLFCFRRRTKAMFRQISDRVDDFLAHTNLHDKAIGVNSVSGLYLVFYPLKS